MKPLRIGESVLLLYSLATYAPQFLLHLFNEEPLVERFRMDAGSQYLAGFIPAFLLLVLLLNRLLPHVASRTSILRNAAVRLFESRLNILFAGILVALAVYFNRTQGISFRQSGDPMREAGLAVELLMFCKPYTYAWLIYHFIHAIKADQPPGHARPTAFLFAIALFLSVTGSLDVVPILWTALFAVLPAKKLRRMFLWQSPARPFIIRAVIILVGAPLAACIVGLMVWIGYINKIGVEGTTDLVNRVGVGPIIEQTMIRVSTSYSAVISFAGNNLTNAEIYERAFAVPLENVPYRLSLILGNELPRPEITQISRLNYLSYEADPFLERAGASPGLVASGFYAAPFPFGFILLAVYVVAIVRMTNLAFAQIPSRPKLALLVFCASFIYPLFESPLDYLVFVDPAFAHLLLVVMAFLAAATARAKRLEVVPLARRPIAQ